MIFLTLHSSCSILGEIPQLFHYILTIQPPCPKYRGAISSIILLTVTCDHRVGGRAAFLLGLSRSWVGWEWVIHIREEGGGHDSVHCFRLHSRTCNSRTFLVQVIPSPMTIKHQGYSFLFYLNCPCFIVSSRACHKSKISLNFFGTRIFSWVCIYINRKFWFWRFFFIFRWVKMPPKGYNEKNIKSLISWSLCIFE